MRCFIGSILSEADQQKINALRPNLGDELVRWVKPHKYHVTLQFLGDDVKEEDLSEHRCKLAAWRKAFPITCTGMVMSGFPNPQRARVLVSLLHSEGRLDALRPEQPSFLPHITLGYARRKPIAVPDWSANVRITIPAPSLIESSQGQYRTLKSKAR
ncbi:MAG: hypothetical protein OXG05_06115 [Gammaproteobacteria bacterium]|nr:hypothetical protein [Gammaproteobacteria bacterium]